MTAMTDWRSRPAKSHRSRGDADVDHRYPRRVPCRCPTTYWSPACALATRRLRAPADRLVAVDAPPGAHLRLDGGLGRGGRAGHLGRRHPGHRPVRGPVVAAHLGLSHPGQHRQASAASGSTAPCRGRACRRPTTTAGRLSTRRSSEAPTTSTRAAGRPSRASGASTEDVVLAERGPHDRQGGPRHCCPSVSAS